MEADGWMDLAERREQMVHVHLIGRGIVDERVLNAFRRIPRERFVSPRLVEMAYADEALPIDMGQTISQPSLVAEMLAALRLRGDERVLEIGTGSGYAAALLACIVREVDTVERLHALAWNADRRLRELGFSPDSVRVHHQDGTTGWIENAPYDAIVVAAGGPCVPPSLAAQLKTGGRLLMPVGETRRAQRLVRVTRVDDACRVTHSDDARWVKYGDDARYITRVDDDARFVTDELGPVRFVPLIGVEGWEDAPPAT